MAANAPAADSLEQALVAMRDHYAAYAAGLADWIETIDRQEDKAGALKTLEAAEDGFITGAGAIEARLKAAQQALEKAAGRRLTLSAAAKQAGCEAARRDATAALKRAAHLRVDVQKIATRLRQEAAEKLTKLSATRRLRRRFLPEPGPGRQVDGKA